MWRSFFMAVGIFMILLGLQSLMVDQFIMSNNRRIPKFITSKDGIFANPSSPGQLTGNRPFEGFRNQVRRPFQQLGNQQSAYGPSRYRSFGQSPNYGLASYGTANTASGQASTPIQVSPTLSRPQRIIQTKDWMPWSLLAAGTLIVLYLHSSRPQSAE